MFFHLLQQNALHCNVLGVGSSRSVQNTSNFSADYKKMFLGWFEALGCHFEPFEIWSKNRNFRDFSAKNAWKTDPISPFKRKTGPKNAFQALNFFRSWKCCKNRCVLHTLRVSNSKCRGRRGDKIRNKYDVLARFADTYSSLYRGMYRPSWNFSSGWWVVKNIPEFGVWDLNQKYDDIFWWLAVLNFFRLET